MSLFRCEECGSVENTAVSRYWYRNQKDEPSKGRALCSACDPTIGEWHDIFPRENADEAGYVADRDGFLFKKHR